MNVYLNRCRSSTPWICTLCTVQNSGISKKCEVCENPRPKSSPSTNNVNTSNSTKPTSLKNEQERKYNEEKNHNNLKKFNMSNIDSSQKLFSSSNNGENFISVFDSLNNMKKLESKTERKIEDEDDDFFFNEDSQSNSNFCPSNLAPHTSSSLLSILTPPVDLSSSIPLNQSSPPTFSSSYTSSTHSYSSSHLPSPSTTSNSSSIFKQVTTKKFLSSSSTSILQEKEKKIVDIYDDFFDEEFDEEKIKWNNDYGKKENGLIQNNISSSIPCYSPTQIDNLKNISQLDPSSPLLIPSDKSNKFLSNSSSFISFSYENEPEVSNDSFFAMTVDEESQSIPKSTNSNNLYSVSTSTTLNKPSNLAPLRSSTNPTIFACQTEQFQTSDIFPSSCQDIQEDRIHKTKNKVESETKEDQEDEFDIIQEVMKRQRILNPPHISKLPSSSSLSSSKVSPTSSSSSSFTYNKIRESKDEVIYVDEFHSSEKINRIEKNQIESIDLYSDDEVIDISDDDSYNENNDEKVEDSEVEGSDYYYESIDEDTENRVYNNSSAKKFSEVTNSDEDIEEFSQDSSLTETFSSTFSNTLEPTFPSLSSHFWSCNSLRNNYPPINFNEFLLNAMEDKRKKNSSYDYESRRRKRLKKDEGKKNRYNDNELDDDDNDEIDELENEGSDNESSKIKKKSNKKSSSKRKPSTKKSNYFKTKAAWGYRKKR